jgi:hypothetical protein
VKPADIAVLPVQDATPGGVLQGQLDALRAEVAAALAKQMYSPLSNSMVDARVGRDVQGSPVDASHVGSLAGRCEEDALLGIKVTRWDERSLMQDGRVDFTTEVLLLDAKGRQTLWAGRLDGTVKAGGDGPAPLGRQARTRSALEVFARALIGELPARRV